VKPEQASKVKMRMPTRLNNGEGSTSGEAIDARSLFAGSEEGAQTWAVMASLLQTARLGGLDPYTWLNDVLERMVTGAVKVNELDILLPWNWRPAAEPVKALAA
jgi:hypothetical protein